MTRGTSERRAHRRGTAAGGRHLVVVVGGSWFGKVVGTWAVIGVASTEWEGSR
jgi:hypothetical protein